MNFLWVFLGGGLGSMARYMIGQWCYRPEQNFPLGTLLANILSCVLLGFLIAYWSQRPSSELYKLLLITGFCGGFSTFSTFSAETIELYQSSPQLAILYVILSILLGVLSILCGMFLYQYS